MRQRTEYDDGTWIYGATSFQSFVHQNRHHLSPAPNVPAVMPRLARKVFQQHGRCFMCHQPHHPGLACAGIGHERNVAADVLQQMDSKARGAEAVKRDHKKIADTRSAVASLRFQTEGPRDRNRGRGRGGGRAAEPAPAPVHQQQDTWPGCEG